MPAALAVFFSLTTVTLLAMLLNKRRTPLRIAADRKPASFRRG